MNTRIFKKNIWLEISDQIQQWDTCWNKVAYDFKRNCWYRNKFRIEGTVGLERNKIAQDVHLK